LEEPAMSLELSVQEDAKTLEVHVTGKLVKEDYERFVPEVEALVKKLGKVSILLEMRDFHGWQACAAWEDFKFGLKHFADIRRLALVGEKKWQKGMAVFCRPFTRAEIRYFEHDRLEEARQWVRAE
jgi:hypothetical protein